MTTEAQLDRAYAARDKFLEQVRAAYMNMFLELRDDRSVFDVARNMSQDNLSLFSPWMNKTIEFWDEEPNKEYEQ